MLYGKEYHISRYIYKKYIQFFRDLCYWVWHAAVAVEGKRVSKSVQSGFSLDPGQPGALCGGWFMGIFESAFNRKEWLFVITDALLSLGCACFLAAERRK
jgi:hypothetical protein